MSALRTATTHCALKFGSFYSFDFFFFFSSRRRHTRCLSDWSSDVCSSDLVCRLLLENRSGRDSSRVPYVSRTGYSDSDSTIDHTVSQQEGAFAERYCHEAEQLARQ